jgi:threonylcarbamoyladenosine tRNA methylthiotransferase MtaB
MSRSTSPPDIVSQVQTTVEEGYQEIVLTGVNVGDYGTKIGTNLVGLLRELVGIDGLSRIRVSSIEPNLLTDELVAFWASNPKLCKHFHIPLQGGSDVLLRGMRRRYLTDLYRSRIEHVRTLMPTAGIGADVITGFPGESDTLFEESYRFLVDLPISYLHVFTYSERPNTAALGMEGRVEPRVRFERSEMLRNLSLRKRRTFHDSLLGTVGDVLFEEKLATGEWTGLTGEYARVRVMSDRDLSNRIAQVSITQSFEEDCIGTLVDTSLAAQQSNSPTFPEVSLCA